MACYREFYPNLSVVTRIFSSSSDSSGSSFTREVWRTDRSFTDGRCMGVRQRWHSFETSLHCKKARFQHRGVPGLQQSSGRGHCNSIRHSNEDVSVMSDQNGMSKQRFIPYGRSRWKGKLEKTAEGTHKLRAEGEGKGDKRWFRITIPSGKKYDKRWLLTSLQNHCPLAFAPMHYSTEGLTVQFFLEDFAAAVALSRLSRRITDCEGQKVVVLVSSVSCPPFLSRELGLQDLEHLTICMSRCYDHTKKSLDLKSIHTAPELVSHNIDLVLNQKSCMEAVINIIGENIPELLHLNLSRNKLCKLDDLAELVNKSPHLQSLNLSQNELKSDHELDKVKGLGLLELWLDRNPLRNHFKDQTTYISYYSVYDSGNRQPLMEAYHEGACFSLCLASISKYCRSEDYEHSRNLKDIREPSARFGLLKHTSVNVVAFLTNLPKTQHDLSSVTVDVLAFTSTLLAFTVSGVFRELDEQSGESIKAFSRVFLAVPAQNAGLCVVNDELFVRKATVREVCDAFKAPVLTTSPSLLAVLSGARQEMISSFSQMSRMNNEWTQKCLEDNDWDFDKASHIFCELKAQGKIPEAAFIT
ncbi:hypothetical protein DNTS_031621 [Danionella cerebrum]|uniref:Nuclear RNA export factor Tap RNA-binding domain-containing protein n=1 Tax=Danionella cerebrum TaxID=2873325 RepID=A0A553QJM7_9TELE|nr:hypothetical protein DNTS_031621 [Danionella translucida]